MQLADQQRTGASPLLTLRGLRAHLETQEGVVRAVDGVDLDLHAGQTFGLVGESGCGKSMTALSILGLLPRPQGRIVGGEIIFDGRNLLRLAPAELRRLRGGQLAMIFQEPMTALNPVLTIGRQIGEALRVHHGLTKPQAWAETAALLDRVGIPAPRQRASDYPHQLSGGMRQRAMIAMAMAGRPRLLIADEPTTALDVTIQAQILDLIQEIKEESGLAVLLITHNFGVIAETTVRTAVMYAGQVVEEAPTAELFARPRHPYTQGLLRSLPRLGEKFKVGRRKLAEIPGLVPSLMAERRGCAFAARCPQRRERCLVETPLLVKVGRAERVRCFDWAAAVN